MFNALSYLFIPYGENGEIFNYNLNPRADG